ncbi:MAG: SPASM domain-containing protein, partial [Clostridia bacterium]|nr:SPASM domain-containing protein [Clostridia bacterium]
RGYRDYYLRGTFTSQNLDFMQDVLHLVDEGFDQISVEPVVADAQMPYAITMKDLPRIYAEYEKLAAELLRRNRAGKKINFFHFMIDLENGPCAIKLLRGCGCGNEYVAVTPEGDLYPCHQFVGRNEWKMGNVMEQEGIYKSEMKDRFSRIHIYSKPACRDCWAKFFCGGGCEANNDSFSGDLCTPPVLTCRLEQKRIECAIMIKAVLAETELSNS